PGPPFFPTSWGAGPRFPPRPGWEGSGARPGALLLGERGLRWPPFPLRPARLRSPGLFFVRYFPPPGRGASCFFWGSLVGGGGGGGGGEGGGRGGRPCL